jgi:hypothetical protein
MARAPTNSRIWPSISRSGRSIAACTSGAISGTISASGRIAAEQVRGGFVGQVDQSALVEADHAGRHARQHRLGKPPAQVELVVRLDQIGLLGFQLLGHEIERAAQAAELVILVEFGRARREVAAADLLGRHDQAADAARNLARRIDAEPDRGQQQQQRRGAEDQDELDLVARPLALESLVLRRRRIGRGQVIEHARVDRPPDIEHGVRDRLELDDGADPILRLAGQDRDFAGRGFLERPGRNRLHRQRGAERRLAQHVVRALGEHQGLGQTALAHLVLDEGAQPLRRAGEAIGIAVDVGRDFERIGADILLMLLEIGLGDRAGFFDRRADLVAEPGFHAEAEEQVREDRDDDGRRDRDHAEQHDQPDVQARSGEPPSALGPDLDQPLGHDRAEHQQQHEIEREQQQHAAAVRPERRRPGEDDISRQHRADREHAQHDGRLAAEPRTGCPQGEAMSKAGRDYRVVRAHTVYRLDAPTPRHPSILGHG